MVKCKKQTVRKFMTANFAVWTSLFCIMGMQVNPAAGELLKIKTISDLNAAIAKPIASDGTVVLIHPGIGSEVREISSEREISEKLFDYLKDKRAIGFKHDVRENAYYYEFQMDSEAKGMTLEERLETIAGKKSKLIDLLNKSRLRDS